MVAALGVRGTAALLALLAGACASVPVAPPAARARARAVEVYSARLRVSLRGPELRARTALLVGFVRPDALRLELPGPTGARLIAVARDGRLTAVFPAERAVLQDVASSTTLRHLLGVELEPRDIMDLLTGSVPPRLRACSITWGAVLPRKLDLTLPDGAHLALTVEDPQVEVALPAHAFDEPPHAGFREVSAEEARRLWAR